MFRNFLQSRFATVGLALALGFVLLSIIKIQPALISVRKEIKNLDQKISEIDRSEEEIRRLGEYVVSPVYLEKQARIKLNYKKPDENVVYIYNKTTEVKSKLDNPEKGFIEKIISAGFYKNFKSWWNSLTGD